MKIRFATAADSSAILKIYAQYIDTPITFECALPTEAEFARRIQNIIGEYPYLVCEEAGQIVGYAYAHRQMEREAYQWNAELSVYISRQHTSRGLGRKFYGILMEILKLQGIKTVYGGITLPNEKSEKLHTELGFACLGTYHSTGYKCGKWYDVAWFEKQIAPYEEEPKPFTPITGISQAQLEAILAAFCPE